MLTSNIGILVATSMYKRKLTTSLKRVVGTTVHNHKKDVIMFDRLLSMTPESVDIKNALEYKRAQVKIGKMIAESWRFNEAVRVLGLYDTSCQLSVERAMPRFVNFVMLNPDNIFKIGLASDFKQLVKFYDKTYKVK